MFANLRAAPIEGHVTDSAGNVIRNSQIIIKNQTPYGSIIIDSIKSDDAGYFISSPIPNGIYDIYESGIKISRVIHETEIGGIQSFQADRSNYNPSIIGSFPDLAADQNLNSYKSFIQIEAPYLNTAQYGNIFPLYEYDISVDPESGTSQSNEIYAIKNFFQLSSSSRITISRFDIEYYSPLTSSSSNFKRIRWAGVPGIRFYEDSKLVLPLDYYSIVTNNPKMINPQSIGYAEGEIINDINYSTGKGSISDSVDDGVLKYLTPYLFVGDILKIRFKNESYNILWYGIVTEIKYDTKKVISLEKWKSSKFVSTGDFTGVNIDKIFAFDGMFSNIMDIGSDVNQLFTVTENFSAQNQESELYNYLSQ